MPQIYDIVTTYKPDVLWTDGDWEASSDYWMSKEFLAWLYNDRFVHKMKIVLNYMFKLSLTPGYVVIHAYDSRVKAGQEY